MGIGPAGDGVLHTSGNDIAIPLLPAWTTVREFTFNVAGITIQLLREIRAVARSLPSDAPQIITSGVPAYSLRRLSTAQTAFKAPLAAPTSPMQSAGCQNSFGSETPSANGRSPRARTSA